MTNLKIVAVVIFTLAVYTLVANMIPQVESDVPQAMDLSGGVTAEQLVSAGEAIYNGAGGCTACHGLGTRAPNLLSGEGGLGAIGARCGDRVPGTSCKQYLHESLVDPNAFVVEGYNPIMPDMSRTLSEQQVWALVAFLQSQGGDVTVTADDLPTGGAPAGETASGATGGAGGPEVASMDPRQIIQDLGCLQCHRLGDQGAPLGPPFDGLGAQRSSEYIRRSILRPNADTAQGYEAFAGTMPPNFGDRLTASQLDTLVSFLAGQE